MPRLLVTVVLLLLVCGVSPAMAQWRPPDPKAEPWRDARLRLGPIFFNPTFQVRDVGIDDNVFNDVDGNEREDLTGTLSMTSLVGLQARAFLLTVQQANSYIWYRTYTSERSVDGALKVVGEFRLGYLRPWASWERTETHERGGYEIDARAGRELPAWEVGTDLKFGWRIAATGSYRSRKLRYAEGEEFNSIDLGQALDHKAEELRGYGRLILTDFTDAIAGVEYNRVRYDHSTLRDSDDVFYFAGLESSGESRLGLNLRVGWLEQRHTDPTVVGFKGVTADGSFGFVVGDFMRLDFSGRRGIGISYEEIYPYYIEQGGEFRSMIRFSEHFDLRFDAKNFWLEYDETVTGTPQPRTERSAVLGGEFGYYFGGATGTRVAVRYEYSDRTSPVDIRNYSRGRVLSTFRLSF